MKISKNRVFWAFMTCMAIVPSIQAMNNEIVPFKPTLTAESMQQAIHDQLMYLFLPTGLQACIAFIANAVSPNTLHAKFIANGIGFSVAKLFKIMRHYYPLYNLLDKWATNATYNFTHDKNGNLDENKLKYRYTLLSIHGPCKFGRAFGYYSLGATAGMATSFTAEQIITFAFLVTNYLQSRGK